MPMRNGSYYVSLLHDFKGRRVMCEFCGTETASESDLCICSGCECLASSSREGLEAKDHELLGALDSIRKSTESKDFAAAAAAYDALTVSRKVVQLDYAAAVAYIRASNSELTEINYMKEGFMEDNPKHRVKSEKLMLSAKNLLARAIATAESEMAKGEASTGSMYGRFLSMLKMDMGRGASQAAKELEKSGNKFVSGYANMLLLSHKGDYRNLLASAEEFTRKGNFSTNAFYYVAYALFRLGKAKDAKAVMEALKGLMSNVNSEALLFEIDASLSIWK